MRGKDFFDYTRNYELAKDVTILDMTKKQYTADDEPLNTDCKTKSH